MAEDMTVGAMEPLGFFDPLGYIDSPEKFERYRAVERKVRPREERRTDGENDAWSEATANVL